MADSETHVTEPKRWPSDAFDSLSSTSMRCLAPIEVNPTATTPALTTATTVQNTLPKPIPPTPMQATPSEDGILASGVPVVQLQVDTVTDAVAARLASGLLGHVLFLKNQIPLPVPQLSRIPSKNSTSRGAKHRAELLASFDTLTSHLTTTFSALSLALYKSYSEEKLEKLKSEYLAAGDGGAAIATTSSRAVPSHLLDRAYLAVALGPSLGTAKSRTFLAIDRFEARVWGLGEGKDENGCEDDSDGEGESGGSGSESESGDEEDEDENAHSSAEEPEDSDDDNNDNDDEGSSSEESENEVQVQPGSSPLQETRLKPRQPNAPVPPIPAISYAEEQKFLQNSERLLSRVLAAADSEGYGFAAEMAPTQTHILIRAPRRFVHPAWTPRQNITASLESSLQEFLTRSSAPTRQANPVGKKSGVKKKQQHSEGVWVTSRAGLSIPSLLGGAEEDLEDEMIWWSWDGRIAGFAEW